MLTGEPHSFSLFVTQVKLLPTMEITRVDVDMINIESSCTKGVIDLESIPQGKVAIKFTPERRGQHQLNVKINGTHIKNSPL